MLNNKGQSLIIFILCLPLLLLFLTYVIDTVRVNYEKNKLESIIEISKEEETDKICDIALKNDKDLNCEISNNTVVLNKRIKSLFGKIIGKEYYNVKVSIKI